MSTNVAGVLLVIGLGVAMGVAAGVVLLFGLLYCFRRLVVILGWFDNNNRHVYAAFSAVSYN